MAVEQQSGDVAGGRPASGVDAAGLARAAVGLLGGEAGGPLAGLAALAAAFEAAGLGAAFRSWVGPGANVPIAAAELERALGAGVVGRLAQAAGADPARVAAGLAELLPRVVDQLTPAGVLPDATRDPADPARRLAGRP